MTAILLEPLVLEAFSTRVAFEGEHLIVALVGNADLRVRKALDVMLKTLHAEAMRLSLHAVIIDVTQLEFMNSSCFKCFVSWLGKVRDLPRTERYRVVFASNRELHWQRRSLNALRCFAMELVTIEA
jgi:hypothetical protein